jgi:hypothetical protein
MLGAAIGLIVQFLASHCYAFRRRDFNDADGDDCCPAGCADSRARSRTDCGASCGFTPQRERAASHVGAGGDSVLRRIQKASSPAPDSPDPGPAAGVGLRRTDSAERLRHVLQSAARAADHVHRDGDCHFGHAVAYHHVLADRELMRGAGWVLFTLKLTKNVAKSVKMGRF